MGERATYLITGANSGVGREATRQLAAAGHRVIMACRSRERGDAARAELEPEAQAGGGALELEALDLSDQASVRALAERLDARLPRLDGLINNAGVFESKRRLTPAGHERTFAVNVLGPYLLTEALLPLLQRSAPTRIVNVASTFAGDMDARDLQFETRAYNGTQAYRQSKQANRMLTRELAARLRDRGVTVNACSPGMIMTGLYRDAGRGTRAIMWMLSRFMGRSLEEGGDALVHLATDPRFETETGLFFDGRAQAELGFEGDDARLVAACEALRDPAVWGRARA